MDLEYYYINENHKIENTENYKRIIITLLGLTGIGKTLFINRLITPDYIKYKKQTFSQKLHYTPFTIELEVKY